MLKANNSATQIKTMNEQIIFTNSQGLKLHGNLITTEKPGQEVIIMSHGFMSNKEEKGLFSEAAEVFLRSGLASFRFDFSSSGQSESTGITVSKQADDLASAIELMINKGFTSIGLLGYSLGGLYSLLSYSESIKALVLWAPVTASKVPTKLKEESIQRELEEKGYATLTNKEGKDFTIEKVYLSERLGIKQEAIMSKVTCPVMIIHGRNDMTVPVSHSEEAMKSLPEQSQLWVLEDCEHQFKEHSDVVINLSAQWFERHLKSDSEQA